MKEKLLSIVIPTFNRGNVIDYTLSLFHDQVVRNSEEVELIVCNNASTDDTKEVLEELSKKEAWLKIVHYDEHVNIDNSIARSVSNAQGRFIQLFGDDDVPAPMMVDVILMELKKYPQIGLMTFNRMAGCSDFSLRLRGLYVLSDKFDSYELLYTDSIKFTEEHFGNMGFISVDVIRRDVWNKGLQNFSSDFLGYSHLAVLFSGAIGYNCLFLQFPLCIQRDVQKGGNAHSFTNADLGIFQFVGIPRILRRLEDCGAIRSWKYCFEEYEPNRKDNWYYTFVYQIANNPTKYSKFYDEIVEYQMQRKRRKEAQRFFSLKSKILLQLKKFFIFNRIRGWSYTLTLIKRQFNRIYKL